MSDRTWLVTILVEGFLIELPTPVAPPTPHPVFGVPLTWFSPEAVEEEYIFHHNNGHGYGTPDRRIYNNG